MIDSGFSRACDAERNVAEQNELQMNRSGNRLTRVGRSLGGIFRRRAVTAIAAGAAVVLGLGHGAFAQASYSMPSGFDATSLASAVLGDNKTLIIGGAAAVTGIVVVMAVVRGLRKGGKKAVN